MRLRTIARHLSLTLALVAALALSACGGSGDSGDSGKEAQQAGTSLAGVCAAKDKIAQDIDELQSVEIGSPTGASDIVEAMDSIRKDLAALSAEVEKLDGATRQQVEAASDEFRSQYIDLGFGLSEAMTASNAAAQVEKKSAQVADAFEKAFDSVDCQ